MKFLYPLFLLLTFSLLGLSCNKPESSLKEDRTQIIKDSLYNIEQSLYKTELDKIIDETNFNGIVSVFKDDKKLYERSNGFSNFNTKQKIDSATVFAIGSVSKQFTAVEILKLQEKGLLKLSDFASTYLPELNRKSYKDITILQLLNHSSGLHILGQRLMFDKGKGYFYSNEGYRLLGKIITKVTNKSFDENLKTTFNELGMTTASTGNLFIGKDFASAYLGNQKKQEVVANMPKRLGEDNISIAAGGILASSRDLHIWNNALFNNQIINQKSLTEFTKTYKKTNHYILDSVGYGLGIMISDKASKSLLHTGYVKGSPSLNIYYPKTKISTVILSNIADESKGKKAIFKTHRMIKLKIDSLATLNY